MKEYIVHAPADDVLAVERYTAFYGEPAEELIRCKDCKYGFDVYGDGDCYCDNKREMLRYIGDWSHYCGWAKRRTDYETDRC